MVRINVLGDRYFKDRLIIRQQVKIALIFFAASLLACVLFFTWKVQEKEKVMAEIEEAKKELARLKTIRAEVEQLQKYERQVKAILKSIEFLRKIKVGPTIYLDHLNVLMPSQIWLTSIEDKMGRVSVVGFAFSNNAVAEFMDNLQNSDQFISVTLKGVIESKLRGAVIEQSLMKFELSCDTEMGRKMAQLIAKQNELAGAQGKKGAPRRR